ncbi:hypothetical protein Tcan_11623 [Toxocara canis]|uniref:Uncharacterized protein n=1 Tax=Toxocara canis TaxID=6265 RepID=A0A0B2VPY0_TOXCA|nr:hypothetical protein Tcan_11623 [Toxocara canis]
MAAAQMHKLAAAATLLPNTAASLITATGNPYSYMFDAQKMDRLAGAARAQQSLQDLSQVFNGFQSYAPLAATSPPGSAAANGAANGGVARGFSVAAAQAAAAQQAVALEAAALYASVGVFNGFQSYAPLAATSPPGSAAANGAANGGVARGFSVAAAQAAAAQQAVALEAAALYASVGGEPFPAIYPPMHHQSAQMPHAFHKV